MEWSGEEWSEVKWEGIVYRYPYQDNLPVRPWRYRLLGLVLTWSACLVDRISLWGMFCLFFSERKEMKDVDVDVDMDMDLES